MALVRKATNPTTCFPLVRLRTGWIVGTAGAKARAVMKTSLKFLALCFAASLPISLAAQFAGISLPASVGPTTLFAGFASTLVLLTACSDYSRTHRNVTRAALTACPTDSRKAEHPLAA